jgi:mannitol/fructose-specific phosphotransferase system IIA component (Ntr-type)
MQWVLRRPRPKRCIDYIGPRLFLGRLRATTRSDAIREIVAGVCAAAGLDAQTLTEAVLAREELMPTGLGHGVAAPHARIENLSAPLIGVGLARHGIDFEAPDGEPAQVIFLLLTPASQPEAQVELLADIARTFASPPVRDRVVAATSYTEFLAVLRSGRAED